MLTNSGNRLIKSFISLFPNLVVKIVYNHIVKLILLLALYLNNKICLH